MVCFGRLSRPPSSGNCSSATRRPPYQVRRWPAGFANAVRSMRARSPSCSGSSWAPHTMSRSVSRSPPARGRGNYSVRHGHRSTWNVRAFSCGTHSRTSPVSSACLPPKTRNSRRTIELSGATVALLPRHRAEQNAVRLRLGAAWENHDLVFPDPSGRYQYRQAFYTGVRRLLPSSGIDDPRTVNFHSLRHTAASQWIKAGVDLLTVSRRLGHGSAAFTMDVTGIS